MSDSAPTVGERLRAERERRGMSAQKVADEMHLDVWVIDALETGNYQRIGPSVYARGHLKRYANILGLPAALVAAGDEARAPASDALAASPSVVMRMPRTGPAPIRAPWAQIASLVLLVLAVAAAVWWRPWSHHVSSARPAAPHPAAGHAAAPGEPAARPSDHAASGAPPSSDAEPAEATPAEATPAEASAAGSASSAPHPAAAGTEDAAGTDAAPLPGAGPARLRLSFSADSWVDVRDATGRRVFAGNGHANSVQTIAGMAPLTVYLGYAGGVQLEINDHVVAIGPQFVSGDVARFEAGADGVLRRAARPSAPGAPARPDLPHG